MTTAMAGRGEMNPARPRLTIDVSPEMRRDIRLEAAKRDVSITDYVTYLILLGRDADRAGKTTERRTG